MAIRFTPDKQAGVRFTPEINNLGGITSEPIDPEEQMQLDEAMWGNEQLRLGNIKSVPLTFWQQMQKDMGQMIGATTGSIAGGALAGIKYPGHPYVRLAAMVGGAIVGGMGGKGYQQLYEMNQPGAEPKTMGELYGEQLKAGLIEGGSELVGNVVTSVAGKLLRPLAKKVIPRSGAMAERLARAGQKMPTEELSDYAKRLATKKRFWGLLPARGVYPTAAQLTESRGMDFMESATESTIFGGNRLYQLKRILHPTAYKQATKDLSEEFWSRAGRHLSPEDTGRLFIDTITGGKEAVRRSQRILYGQVDVLTKEAGTVDLRPAKKMAQHFFEEADKSSNLGSSRTIKNLTKKVLSLPDTTDTFMDAHAIRSNILEEIRNYETLTGIKNPKANRVANFLANSIDSSMAKTAKSQSDEAYMAWRAANKVTREGKELFENDYIKQAIRLAKKNPEKVAPSQFTVNGTAKLHMIKKAVDKDTYQILLASWLDDTMRRSSTADGIVMGKTFKSRILGLGTDMNKEMFDSPRHLQDILDVANLGEMIQKPTGGGGGMVAQLTQAGAIIDVAVGIPSGAKPRKGSGLILFGPAVMGRILSTPEGAQWLSTGFKSQNAKYWSKVPPVVVRIMREYAQQQQQEEMTKSLSESKKFGSYIH